jgi:dihydropteroate synthase
MFTLNCRGNLLTIDSPIIMGIINATPDSFFKGNIDDDIVDLAAQMIADGATILDAGGQSTKPNSHLLSAAEEMERVLPVIKKIHSSFPKIIISVDTFYSEVAKAVVDAGASIINDISAGNMDKQMLTTVAQLNVPYVCMHMQGTPATMQQNPRYNNISKDVLDFFIQKITDCKSAGIKDVIIDPGFGFGKTIEHNYTLLKNLSIFSMLDCPILAGLSRKSIIYKPLNTTATEALNGTTALNMIALLNGATILRVHDVKEAKEAIDLFTTYKKASQ